MPANDDLIHGWVSTDCGRGTSGILWSCLATIFPCVWTAMHLPIPYYHAQWPLSTRQKLLRSNIGTALIGVLVPEFLAVTAIAEMTGCSLAKEEIRRLTEMNWTLTHQFFLNMGGVCLRSSSGNCLGRMCEWSQRNTHRITHCQLTDCPLQSGFRKWIKFLETTASRLQSLGILETDTCLWE